MKLLNFLTNEFAHFFDYIPDWTQLQFIVKILARCT